VRRAFGAIAAWVSLGLLGLLGLSQSAAAHTIYVTKVVGDVVVPIVGSAPQNAIGVGRLPLRIAITPDGKTAYVTNSLAGSVTPIDLNTNTAGPAISIGGQLQGVAITPDGRTAYVANGESPGAVTPIDTKTNTAGTAIQVGNEPRGIAITPDGGTAYVTNGGSGTVTPIDLRTGTAEDEIQVGSAPRGIAITPDGQTAYVANRSSNTVTPIDTETNIPGAEIPVGLAPNEIAITPDGKTAYVVNGSNTVTPIDTETNTVGEEIPAGRTPTDIAITPDGRTAYVVNNGSPAAVTPIDLETRTPGEAIQIGDFAQGIAIAPNQPPTAELAVDADTVYAGTPVTFDASGSDDDMGIERYRFEFGDGWTFSSNEPVYTYVYEKPGTYEATVTVDDGEGCPARHQSFPELAVPFTGQTAYCSGPSRATSKPVEIHVRELPRLGLSLSLGRRQLSLKAVRVTATCKNLECDAKASGTLEVRRRGAKPKSFKLRAPTAALRADTPTALDPRIPAKARRAARKALKARGKVLAKVRVEARGPGDQLRVRTGRVRIVG